jgi:diadenosine tetraphosphate (Ap4A) HIT family hydrolase
MARRYWYCEDILSGEVEVRRVWEDDRVLAVQRTAQKLGLDRTGFYVRTNAAAPGVTPHMHWHVVGPGIP